jgi:phosphoribosylformimino-5-aminoimidazole carboxamide ribotide isomerase
MYMAQGVSRVVIGTEAIKNPDLVKTACHEFPGQIVVGIDAKGGKVAIEGWTKTTGVTAVELARQFEDCGVAAINFTDIERDGMRTGPNLKETEKLALSISIPVVASGGVSSIQDIKNLALLESSGVVGVISGRALYDGSLDLRAAIEIFNNI